jgi:hypothetical protein
MLETLPTPLDQSPEQPPERIVWMKRSTPCRDLSPFKQPKEVKTGPWVVMDTKDTCLLEAADEEDEVVLSDTLHKVNLKEMEQLPIYWLGAVYKVIRARWFLKGQPLDDALAEELEQHWRKIQPWIPLPVENKNSLPQERTAKLSNGKYVVFQSAEAATVLIDIAPLAVHSLVAGVVPTSVSSLMGDRVVRGHHNLVQPKRQDTKELPQMPPESRPTSPEPQVAPVQHLMFSIHGIGQKLMATFDSNFVTSVNTLRKKIQRIDPTIQVLPICWRHLMDFGSQQSADAATLAHITLSDISEVRSIINDCIADVLLYLIPKFRSQMLRAVSLEICRVYSLFKELNPNFDGKVSIFAHSLGTQLALDLCCLQNDINVTLPSLRLSQNFPIYHETFWGPHADPPELIPHLPFEVENLFLCGSPCGLFLVLRGGVLTASFSPVDPGVIPFHPKCKRMYNILHPNDPIAYRLEPMVTKELTNRRPKMIEWRKGGLKEGFNNLLNNANKVQETTRNVLETLTRWAPSWDKKEVPVQVETEGTFKNDVLNALNPRHERIDFLIQAGILENPYLNALSAHFVYFEEQDVVEFVVGEVNAAEEELFFRPPSGLDAVADEV